MSFVNINYSTLEDAWGTNFDRSKKQKPRRAEPDPVCALYGKRYKKASPPYARRRREEPMPAPSFETDEEYRKYYGYKDARASQVYTAQIPSGYITEEERREEKPPPRKQKGRRLARKAPAVRPTEEERPVHAEETPYEEIDLEVEPVRAQDEYAAPRVEQEDIDAYLSESEEEEDPRYSPPRNRVGAQLSPALDRVFEEEEQFNPRDDVMRERMYLEIGLFTISGILMIFAMEQFIQIGIKLKAPNISA